MSKTECAGSERTLDLVVDAHKKQFNSEQALVDAAVMEAAFASAAHILDYMTRMRMVAEYFRANAEFIPPSPLSDAELIQDVQTVAREHHYCEQGGVPKEHWMRWIACSFRIRIVHASAPCAGASKRNGVRADPAPMDDLCADGAHEFVPFQQACSKCDEPYRSESNSRVEADPYDDLGQERAAIARMPGPATEPNCKSCYDKGVVIGEDGETSCPHCLQVPLAASSPPGDSVAGAPQGPK